VPTGLSYLHSELPGTSVNRSFHLTHKTSCDVHGTDEGEFPLRLWPTKSGDLLILLRDVADPLWKKTLRPSCIELIPLQRKIDEARKYSHGGACI